MTTIAKESPDTERTVVIATYGSRHEAEVARDALENEDLRALISADDGGGMYIQMQYTNGVKLHVPSGEAEEARRVLGSANMLPGDAPVSGEDSTFYDGSQENAGSFARTAGAVLVGVSLVLLVVAAAFFRMDFVVGAAFVGVAGWMIRTLSG